MNNLAIINTWFQFVTLVNLIDTNEIVGNVDLIVTDQTQSLYDKSFDFQQLKGINKVCRIQTKIYTHCSKKHKLVNLLKSFSDKSFVENELKLCIDKYDVFYFNNYDFINEIVYRYAKRKNKEIIANRFEEGYGNYLIYNNKIKTEKINRALFNLKLINCTLIRETKKFYVYNEQYFSYEMAKEIQVNKISPLNKMNTSEIKKIFPVEGISNFYNNKYIIFEDCYYVDGCKEINDMQIYNNIKDFVGIDNIVGKMHPRSLENRFSDIDIKTENSSWIPWEIIEMFRTETETVYITIASGSVISPIVYFDKNATVIFLYKMFDSLAGKIPIEMETFINKLKENPQNKIFVPKSEDELYKLLTLSRKQK